MTESLTQVDLEYYQNMTDLQFLATVLLGMHSGLRGTIPEDYYTTISARLARIAKGNAKPLDTLCIPEGRTQMWFISCDANPETILSIQDVKTGAVLGTEMGSIRFQGWLAGGTELRCTPDLESARWTIMAMGGDYDALQPDQNNLIG